MKHHGNLTEEEKDFIGSLSALMVRHNVGIEYDPQNVPVFITKDGDSGVFLSIHDVANCCIFQKFLSQFAPKH